MNNKTVLDNQEDNVKVLNLNDWSREPDVSDFMRNGEEPLNCDNEKLKPFIA